MIAVVTPSGAFLYDLSVHEADNYAGTNGFLDKKALESCMGWLCVDCQMAYLLLGLGISICYVDLESMQSVPQRRSDYVKIGALEFQNMWNQLYPIKKRIKGADKCF